MAFGSIAEAAVDVVADTSKFERDVNTKVKGSLDSASKRLTAFGQSTARVGRSLTTGLTLPLVGIGVAGFKLAADFDAAMNQIVGLVGIPREQVNAWRDDVRALAVEFGKSGQEAADALFFITSAGLRGDEAMDALTASLKASASGLGETKVVADLVTSAMNAYKDSGLTAAQATDVLTAAVREGKLEPAALAASMSQVLPVASSLGVSFDQVAAAQAAMSKSGTPAAQSATQLTAIFSSLLNPSEQANEILGKYGLTAEGLRKQLGEQGLLPVLKTLSQTVGQNEEEFARTFGSVEALRGVMNLANSDFKDADAVFRGVKDSTGALDAAFAEVSVGSGFQLQQAMAAIKDALITLGDALAPIVLQVAGAISSFASGFSELSPSMQRVIVVVGVAVAAIGPLLIIIGKVIVAVGLIVGAFAKVKVALLALKVLFLTNPFLLVATAIIALVIVVVKNWDTIKSVITTAWNVIKSVTATVWNAIKAFVGAAIRFLVKIFLNFTGPGLIIKHWNTIRAATLAVWNAIKAFISAVFRTIVAIIRAHINAARAVISGAWNVIRAVFSAGVNAARSVVTGGFNRIVSAVRSTVGSMLGVVRGIPGRIKSALGNLGRLLFSAGQNVIRGLINGIKSMIGAVGKAVGGVVSKIRNALPFSPAKEGPLAGRGDPTRAGRRIAEMIAAGMSRETGVVQAAAERLARATLTGLGTPTINLPAGAVGRPGRAAPTPVQATLATDVAALAAAVRAALNGARLTVDQQGRAQLSIDDRVASAVR